MFKLIRLFTTSVRLTLNVIFFPIILIMGVIFIKIFEDIIRIFKTNYSFPIIGDFLNKMFANSIWKGLEGVNFSYMINLYQYLALITLIGLFAMYFLGGNNILIKLLRSGTDVRDFLKKEKEAQNLVLKIVNIIKENYQLKEQKELSFNFKIKLIDSKIKNAVIFSDNLIVVTTELIFNSTENVLKGVIAHEIGHFINGDTSYNQLNLMNSIVSNNIHGGFLNNFMINIAVLFFKIPLIGPFIFILLFVLFFPFLILILIFSIINLFLSFIESIIVRKQEYNADLFAFNIDCGSGLIDFLYDNLYQQENFYQITSLSEMSKATYRSLFLTHPASHKRIKKLEKLSKE